MKQIIVVAPSNSMSTLSKSVINYGVSRLEQHGYVVKVAKNVYENSVFDMGSIHEKMMDFNYAMEQLDSIIFPVFGGYNSNSLLDCINYEMYNSILIGYSDITALMNAIYVKTKKKSIHGLSFAALCEPNIDQYSLNNFFALLNGEKNLKIEASDYYYEDFWFTHEDMHAHKKIKSTGWIPISEGNVEGIVLGGNIETLLTLAGTKFFPEMDDAILLFEISPDTSVKRLFSFFTQLKYLNVFKKIKGMIIGAENPGNTRININNYIEILKELCIKIDFPIIANTNFSHYDPIYSLIIGGRTELNSEINNTYIKIKESIF